MNSSSEFQQGEIIIYQTDDGLTQINVKMLDNTVWLTQAQIVELYQSSKSNVSEHIAHIFEDGELEAESVVRSFRTTHVYTKTPKRIHGIGDMHMLWNNSEHVGRR